MHLTVGGALDVGRKDRCLALIEFTYRKVHRFVMLPRHMAASASLRLIGMVVHCGDVDALVGKPKSRPDRIGGPRV